MGKIILRLDRMMVERKMSLNELAERVGISNVNLSKIKNNKVTRSASPRSRRSVRRSTAMPAIFLNTGKRTKPEWEKIGKPTALRFFS